MDYENIAEKLNDVSAGCGCYELGDWCYDHDGEPTHEAGQECNN